jgi:hypothetical protein
MSTARATVRSAELVLADGTEITVRAMDDGNVDIVFPETAEPVMWAVTKVFTGGTTGTRVSLRRVTS